MCFVGGDGNAHAPTGFDAFDGAIEANRLVQSQFDGESGADPKRVRRFYEHAVGTEVASARTKHCGAPLDLEIGVVAETRRPTALEPANSLIPTAHKPGEAPYSGSQATAQGRSRRLR